MNERRFATSSRRRHTVWLITACAACATPVHLRTAARPAPGGGTHFNLHASAAEPAPDLVALAARFYSSDFSLDLGDDVEAAVAEHDDTALAHEMAAYLARLRGDTDAAWQHFMSAAADVSSPLCELYLREAATTALTTSRLRAALELTEAIASGHPNPNARAMARQYAINYLRRLGRLDEAKAYAQQLGRMNQAQSLGPFDNDQGQGFLTAYPPEEGVDLEGAVPGRRQAIRWRPVELWTPAQQIPLASLIAPPDWSAAYVVTWVESATARDALLRLTTTDPLRAWLNGALVISEERVEEGGFDNVVAPVKLGAGWNRLLVKSAHRTRNWLLGLRITDGRGSVPAGLRYSNQPHPFAPATATTAPPELLHDPFLNDVTPPGRRTLLQARSAVLRGHEERALPMVQDLLDHQPQNLLVTYIAALVLWSNDELGKAIDLLGKGVAAAGNEAAGFLSKRASFYAGKRLWDKAQEDLLAIPDLMTQHRDAAMLLAGVFGSRGWQVDRCQSLKEITERWPDSCWALRELGSCLRKRGYVKAARELFLRSEKLEPGSLATETLLFDLAAAEGDLDDALAYAVRRRLILPTSSNYAVAEADIHRRHGDVRRAAAIYREMAAQRPDWSRPHQRLGLLAYERGDRRVAISEWKRALELDPDDSDLADHLRYLEPEDNALVAAYDLTDADIAAAIAERAKLEIHPGAKILTLIDHEVTVVSNDGSCRRFVTDVSVALTEEGRDALIRRRVPRGGRVSILEAYNISPEGERQEASSIRGGVVRFRNLKVGSTVVLRYTHNSPPPRFLPNQYVSSWTFQQVHVQTRLSEWVLLLPEGRTLKTAVHGDIDVDESTSDGIHVYRFTGRDIEPLVTEPSMPPQRNLLWRAAVSTVRSWGEYVNWERALLTRVFHGDAELAALAERLTVDAPTVRGKLDHLFDFTAREIRYQQDYEDTIAGVKPHACPVVLQRGYGDCKDKAVLLILMAQQLGIEAHFAILRTTDAGEIDRDIPNQQFNHAIVYIPGQEGIEYGYFIDPTTDGLDVGNLRADDQGAISLVLDPETGDFEFIPIPYQTPDKQFVGSAAQVTINSGDDAVAHLTMTMRGTHAARIRRVLRNEEQAKKLFQALSSSLFRGSTLTGSDVRDAEDLYQPLVLHCDLDIRGTLQHQGDDWRLPVADFFPLAGKVFLEKRLTPLRLGVPESSSFTAEINIPEDLHIKHAPAPMQVTQPCFSLTRTTEVAGNHIALAVHFTRTCTEIDVADYQAFRESVIATKSTSEDQIIFGRE